MSKWLCSSKSCPLANLTCETGLEKVNCTAYLKAKSALTSYFKFQSFRPGQLSVILPVLHGKDVFAMMATGAGKSLCFYLVPLATSPDAVGVVISPLNSLMDQQVE